MIKEDIKLWDGGRGEETILPAYFQYPTWIVDELWDSFQEVCNSALSAYLHYTDKMKLPHSYLLGLDVLITAQINPDNPSEISDIRPVLVEGPCCNSYPACPNWFANRLYKNTILHNTRPDSVDYPVHPTKILDAVIDMMLGVWEIKGNSKKPVIGIFTRPYPESEEEAAHIMTYNAIKDRGLEVYRITPDEKPYVKENRIWVSGKAIDIGYRRIERIHVPEFYGKELGEDIINNTQNTIWINPWKVDDLRSKTLEEKAFRMWEKDTGGYVSRPLTLLEDEITMESVRNLANNGGYVMKKWNSTGGKGVFLYTYLPKSKKAYDYLYKKYDGIHMELLDEERLNEELKIFENFKEDTSIQQLRFPDAKTLSQEEKLVYDTRINTVYNPAEEKWVFVSGISRSVKCGHNVKKGNSLLTNVSSGAEVAPLVMGYTKKGETRNHMLFGPLAKSILFDKKNSIIL